MATTEIETRLALLEAENVKIKTDLKKLQKTLKKLAKENEDPDKPKKLSGFAKPMRLSNELTTFLGVDSETMMARTDVTKEINKYVKANNLQNPNNKREIILDAKLKTIINAPAEEQVTFFNLQKFMSLHYIKSDIQESSAEEKVKEVPVSEPVTEQKPTVKKIVKRVVKKQPA